MKPNRTAFSAPFPAGYRASGVLLHVTSLPSRYGVGDVGPSAFAWVDQLAAAGQSWWQVLPLGPTGFGHSPYQALSSFAANPLVISPDQLKEDGLLGAEDGASCSFPADHVDFGRVIPFKERLLVHAWQDFRKGGSWELRSAFEQFCGEKADLQAEPALFMALRARFGGARFQEWPAALARREPGALAKARKELAEAIDQFRFGQFILLRHWKALKEYANKRGVRLLGDLPIFVSPDSSDVWANPELFLVDEQATPRVVAGVPPDYFSAEGQLWGNPIYDWRAHRETGYAWWIERLRARLEYLDAIRVDHFRGFEAAWHVPAGAPTAVSGQWVPGPGADFFDQVRQALGGLPLLAEDLGVITPEVTALRDRFELPGMRVLQFGFNGDPNNPHLAQHCAPNGVAYTGTHDNDTTRGWYEALPEHERGNFWKCVERPPGAPEEAVWELIRLAWCSRAALAMTPFQDLLGLGSAARMNTPGRAEGQWGWRCSEEELKDPAWERLQELTRRSNRWAGAASKAGSRKRLGKILAPLLLLGVMVSTPSRADAQANSEADQIRDELRQLKQEYQQRIDRLEERLRRLEAPATPPATNLPAARVDSGKTAPATAAAPNTNALAAARQFANEQFRDDTETREGVRATDSQPMRERVEQVLQDFMDIHGYIRAGYGRNDKGGPQVGFGAPGALSKYRLGNEAENYGEITFGKNFYVPNLFSLEPRERPEGTPTGPIARVQLTLSMYNPYQELLSSQDTTFGLPEAFASIGNVFAAQPSMKFWAGSRYYRRNDIHISDFFYYNMSGTGGGMEDFQLPFGKIAFAWIGAASSSGFSDLPQPDAQNKAGFSKANWDLRLYDVPLPLGKGEFGVVYARADSGLDAHGRSAPGSEGAAITFMHTAERFVSPDGFNKFSLQFGTGPAKTFTSGFETMVFENGLFIRPEARNSWRFRATEHFVADVNEHFSVGPALVYQMTDYTENGGMAQWASAGVRPILRFNGYLSLASEGGVDWVKSNEAGTSDYLWKVTLAPQVSLGSKFFGRPVIRGFVTYGQWGEEFRGQVGGLDYQNETHGLTYGVQMEAWW